jgi:very-short-patch-repair endonuclease
MQKTSTPKNCKNCDKIFTRPYWLSKQQKFCSKKCEFEWKKKVGFNPVNDPKIRKKISLANTKSRPKIICKGCGKIFQPKFPYMKNQQFCSRKCSNLFRFLIFGNPMQNSEIAKKSGLKRRLPKKSVCCKQCNRIFKIPRYTKYKFCSRKCFKKYFSFISKKRWEDEKWAKKVVCKIVKKLLESPSGKEKILIDWVAENKLPFVYVGDGNFSVGRKNPDFKHKTLCKLIEFNGFYKHTKKEETERTKYFNERGFDVLFLHNYDLKDKEKTISKISEFGENKCNLEYGNM